MNKALIRKNAIVGCAMGIGTLLLLVSLRVSSYSIFVAYMWVMDYIFAICLAGFGAAFLAKIFLQQVAILLVLIAGTIFVLSVSVYVGFWVYDGQDLWMRVFK